MTTLLFFLSLTLAAKTSELKEIKEEEIAFRGEVQIGAIAKGKTFAGCVPQESITIPKNLFDYISSKALNTKETKDLMRCNSKDCAFNFLDDEIEELEKLKTEKDRQKKYVEFYETRMQRKTKKSSWREKQFIRSKDEAFGKACSGPQLNELLDKRPNSLAPFRISSVLYNEKMRPTTRLLQGLHYKNGANECYAEALVFADHYDIDRVELWSFIPDKKGGTLSLDIRHRLDLLNTWLRRLNKPTFRNELRRLIESELQKASRCLEKP